jgi:hypothetical protein
MGTRLASALAVLIALGIGGCSDPQIVPVDSGAGDDAGIDAGSDDAGSDDAGAPLDAFVADHGLVDAGDGDAGLADAGGGALDAGPEDAGTPDAGPAPTPALAGDVIIDEIMVETTTIADDFGEWFEVHNPSATTAYDLDGCVINDEGNSHVISRSLVVAPGGHVTLARVTEALGTGFAPSYVHGTLKFGNAGDSVWISCSGTEIDRVAFTGWTLVEGRAYSLDPSVTTAAGNDAASAWCPAANAYRTLGGPTDYGTPNAANPSCP